MSSWRDDLDLEHGTHPTIAHALHALRGWPFPPPSGPTPWSPAQEREYAKQQREQLPEAPL